VGVCKGLDSCLGTFFFFSFACLFVCSFLVFIVGVCFVSGVRLGSG
jgi:hypothetical protein